MELAKKLPNMKEFDGKSNLISGLIKFFNNLGHLNNYEPTSDLYKGKKITPNFLDFLNNVFESNSSPIEVGTSLKAIKALLFQKLENPNNPQKVCFFFFYFFKKIY